MEKIRTSPQVQTVLVEFINREKGSFFTIDNSSVFFQTIRWIGGKKWGCSITAPWYLLAKVLQSVFPRNAKANTDLIELDYKQIPKRKIQYSYF